MILFKIWGIILIAFYIFVAISNDIGLKGFLLGVLLYSPIPMLMFGMASIIERLDEMVGKKSGEMNVPDSLLENIDYEHDGKWKCFNCGRKNNAEVEVCECGRKREDN